MRVHHDVAPNVEEVQPGNPARVPFPASNGMGRGWTRCRLSRKASPRLVKLQGLLPKNGTTLSRPHIAEGPTITTYVWLSYRTVAWSLNQGCPLLVGYRSFC